MRHGIWITGALLIGVVGCATIDQLAPPVEDVVRPAGRVDDRTLTRIHRGRALYITKCARCHSPEAVTAYSREQWRRILPRMGEEANLSPDENLAIAEYVATVLAAVTEQSPGAAGAAKAEGDR